MPGYAPRDFCHVGHAMTQDNIGYMTGRRYCLACKRKRQLFWQTVNREKVREYQRAYRAQKEFREVTAKVYTRRRYLMECIREGRKTLEDFTEADIRLLDAGRLDWRAELRAARARRR